MEQTFIISDQAADYQEKFPLPSIRLERIGGLNLIHVDSKYVELSNKIEQRAIYLKSIGKTMTQREFRRICDKFDDENINK